MAYVVISWVGLVKSSVAYFSYFWGGSVKSSSRNEPTFMFSGPLMRLVSMEESRFEERGVGFLLSHMKVGFRERREEESQDHGKEPFSAVWHKVETYFTMENALPHQIRETNWNHKLKSSVSIF